MAKTKQKVRVTLSTDLLQVIYSAKESELFLGHNQEITKTIGFLLLKLQTGLITPAYEVEEKELTMEQKLAKGLATTEEVAAYNAQLMEGL